jgi:hypothetical protein
MTEEEVHTLAAAAVAWSDNLAEIAGDEKLRNGHADDRAMAEDCERLGHVAEVLAQKMIALSAALHADSATDATTRERNIRMMDEATFRYLELTV